MHYTEFSKRIKTKYPQYNHLNDKDLALKIVKKYPQYKDIDFSDNIVQQKATNSNIANKPLQQPVEPAIKQPQLMQKTGASLLNPVKDIYNGTVKIVPQLLPMASDMLKSLKDDLTNEQKRADVVPAIARGLVKGALNAPANVVNIGLDAINSVANEEVVGKLAPGGDALFDYLNARNDLAQMQWEMGERKTAPNQVANILLGLRPEEQRATTLESLSEFVLPMAGLNAAKGASQVSKVQKLANANKARILSKLDDAQKVKYANSVDKLANKKAVEAVYKKPTLASKVKDEAIFGGVTGLTEGETFEERVSNAVAGTALGVGGKLLEAGGVKVANTKPVKQVSAKIADTTNAFIDSHPDLANTIGTVSDFLNTDVKNLSQKYKELNHLISKNTSLSKNLTQADLENIKAFQELSPEEQKEVINRIKKGDREYASDEVKKEGWEQYQKEQSGEQVSREEKELQAGNEYASHVDKIATYKEKARRQKEKLDAQKTNEQKTQEKLDEIFGVKKSEAPESNLRHVEETKQPNPYEDNLTHVKNDSDVSNNIIEQANKQHNKNVKNDSLKTQNITQVVPPKSSKVTKKKNTEEKIQKTTSKETSKQEAQVEQKIENKQDDTKKEIVNKVKELSSKNKSKKQTTNVTTKKAPKESNVYLNEEKNNIDTNGFKVVKLEPGKAESVNTSKKTTSENANIDKDVESTQHKDVHTIMDEAHSNKLKKLAQKLEVIEDPKTNKQIIVNKATGKPISDKQLKALRKYFKKYKPETTENNYSESNFPNNIDNVVENVNDNYVDKGYNTQDHNTTTSYKHNLFKKNQAKEVEFMEFYEQYKKKGETAKKNLLKRKFAELTKEERADFYERLQEQTNIDYEANRPRKVGDKSVSNTKELELIVNAVKDFEIEKNNKFKPTEKEIVEANKVIGQVVAKEIGLDKTLKTEPKDRIKDIRNAVKGDNIKVALKNIIEKNPEKAQSIYDELVKKIKNKYVSEHERNIAIKEINNIFDETNADVTKTTSYEVKRKYEVQKDVDALESAVNAKNIKNVQEILHKYDNKLHEITKYDEKQSIVVADAYKLIADDFIKRVNNLDETVKSKIKKDSDYKHYLSIKHNEVEKLRKEYENKKRIIKNSYTDYSSQEMHKWEESFDGTTEGHYESTGDVWDRNSSDVDAKVREYKKVVSEIDSILYSPEMKVLDEYKIKGQDASYSYDASYDKKINKLENELKTLKKEKIEYNKKLSKEIKELESQKNNSYEASKIEAYREEIKRQKKLLKQEINKFDEKINTCQNKLKELNEKKAKTFVYTDKTYDTHNFEKIKNDVFELEKLEKSDKITNEQQIKLNILRNNLKGLAIWKENNAKNERYNLNQQGFNSAKNNIKSDMSEQDIAKVIFKDAKEGTQTGILDNVIQGANTPEGFQRFTKTFSAILKLNKFNSIEGLPESFKNYIKGYEKHVQTVVDAKVFTKLFDNLNDVYNGLSFINHEKHNALTVIVDNNFPLLNKNTRGGTSKDGGFSVVKAKTISQIVSTSFHESVHKALRNPETKDIMLNREWEVEYPDGTTGKIKLTQKDLDLNDRRTAKFKAWKETEEGKFWVENHKKDINQFSKEEKAIIRKGNKKQQEFLKNNKEELVAYTVTKRVKEALDKKGEQYGTSNRHLDDSKRQGDSREIGKSSLESTESGREVRLPGRRRRRKSGAENSEIRERVESEYDSSKTPKENAEKIFGDDTQKLQDETRKIVESQEFVEESELVLDSLDKNFSSKKTYSDIKKATGKVAKAVDAYRNITNEVEKLLLDSKQVTPGQLENRLKQQNNAGEGSYLPQVFRDVNSDSSMFERTSKQGFYGKKTRDGVTTDNPASAYEVQLQKYIKIKHAQDVTNYIKNNFASEKPRFKDDVAINSKVLQAAIQHGKTKDWINIISSGEEAIKNTFKDPLTAKEYAEFAQRCGEPDMYIPKNVLNKVIDGFGETLKEQIENYYKPTKIKVGEKFTKVPGKNDFKYMAKSAGIALDIINNSFKRMVLASGSFVVNNVYGNQMMLMAKADNPGQYFKGLYEAFKLKDSQVPARVIESTLLDATMNSKADKARIYTDYKPFDNFVNLFDGHLITAKELNGMQKQINYEIKKGNLEYAQSLIKELEHKKEYYKKTKIANWSGNILIGIPNKIFKKITNNLFSLNEKLERFSRKQAYAQALDQMKKEKVLTTAQSVVSTGEAVKYIEKSPEISEAIFKRIEDTLGDYENFSPFEKRVLKRIVPFYAWQRTILRHTFNIAKNNPTRIALIYKRLLDIQNEDEDRYDYQKGAIDLGIKDSLSHKNLIINKIAQFPHFAPLQLLNGEHIGSLSPAIRIPLEAIQGKKFFKPSPEITSKQYKAMTYRGKKGYLDKKGKFHEGSLPMSVRANYIAKNIGFNTIYPRINSPLIKGTPDLITNAIKTKGKEIRFPDKMYDASFGGYYDGEKFAKYKNKWKKRSAVNKLSLTSQLLNKAGLSIQNERKIKKKKDK